MRTWRITLAAVGLALAAGCGQSPRPSQTPEQLNGRLDAAKKLADVSQQTDALKTLASDAADAGAVDIVIKAIDGIPNVATKDEAAEACALKLAKRGNPTAATTVAEKIANTQKKNELLAKIAKGAS